MTVKLGVFSKRLTKMFTSKYVLQHHKGALPVIFVIFATPLYVCVAVSYMLWTRDIQLIKSKPPFNMTIPLTGENIYINKVCKSFTRGSGHGFDENPTLEKIYTQMKDAEKEKRKKIEEMKKESK